MTVLALNGCYCGSGKTYAQCCAVIIADSSKAETVEQLMRSRYSAYAQGDLAYIKKTMAGNALKEFQTQKQQGWQQPTEWLGLVVHSSKTLKKKGYVEFTVTYRREGQKRTMREHSEFKKIDGKWFYVDRV